MGTGVAERQALNSSICPSRFRSRCGDRGPLFAPGMFTPSRCDGHGLFLVWSQVLLRVLGTASGVFPLLASRWLCHSLGPSVCVPPPPLLSLRTSRCVEPPPTHTPPAHLSPSPPPSLGPPPAAARPTNASPLSLSHALHPHPHLLPPLRQLWALAGGQLVVSTDVRNMSALQQDILLNTEMLTVFLDPLGAVGKVCVCVGGGAGRGGGRGRGRGLCVGSREL